MSHLLSELHIHTIASGHAFNTVDEIVKYAEAKKYKLIGISDHGPDMEGAPNVGYFEMFSRLPRKYAGMNILYGCEANIIDVSGTLDVPDSFVRSADYVIAGLHKRTSYRHCSEADNTKAVVSVIHSNKVDIISHPVSQRFNVRVREIVQAASICNIMLEANKTVLLSAIRNQSSDVISAYIELFSEAEAAGVHIIFGSDAHHVSEMCFTNEECTLMQEQYGLNLYNLINQKPKELMKFLDERRKQRSEI